jgi:hypothetical protein
MEVIPDSGALLSMGSSRTMWLLALSSGHDKLDVAAVNWAAAKPSLTRLDPGTCVDVTALESLLRIHNVVQPVDAEEYEYLLVLQEVSAGRTFRHVVQGSLGRALERHLSNYEMDRILQGAIRESLQT